MVRIVILIGTPRGRRLVAASTERDAALLAEAALLRLGPGALPAPFWVQCEDEPTRDRLTGYLGALQVDLIDVPADPPWRSSHGLSAPGPARPSRQRPD
ncbi:hypothetical protein [Methylobacterium nigriterrae]|uniref:hypothetical protein n=1 Tax=Methylobacterium nigriterrae TaxID=3127512 RepID=UPI003013BDD2